MTYGLPHPLLEVDLCASNDTRFGVGILIKN